MASEKTSPRPLWQKVLGLGLAYLAGIIASRLLSSHNSPYISVWLPAGVYLGCLLLAETSDWTALVLTALAVDVGVDVVRGSPLVLTLLLPLANTVQAVTGAYLFRRFVARTTRLDSAREFLGLLGWCVIACPAAGATIGAATVVAHGIPVGFVEFWLRWWVGNAMAILLVAPLLLSWLSPGEPVRKWRAQPRRLLEAALILAGLVFATWELLVVGTGLIAPSRSLLLLFVLWPALRFGVRGASAVNVLFALLLIYFTSHYLRGLTAEQVASGAFVPGMQLFLAICALVALIPAVVLAERDGLVRQLGHSEERFRTLSQASHESVFITENGRVVDANDQALRLLGYSRTELLGREVTEFIAPESRPTVERAIATDLEVSYEHRMVVRDKSVIDVEAQAKVMHFGDRKIRMTAVRDVTERKRAAQALRDSEDRHRSMIEVSPEAIVVHREGVVVFANPAAVKMHGAGSAGDLLGRVMLDFVHPDYHGLVLARRREMTERGVEVPMVEMRFLKMDGTPVEVEVQTVPVTFDGAPSTQVTSHDVSERKQAQIVSNRLAAIVTFSDDAIIGKNLDSVVTSWNRGAEKIFGYTAAEMVGSSIQRLIPDERMGEEETFLEKIKRGESIEHFDTVRRRKDGRSINISVTGSPIRDALGNIIGISTVARDTTERVQAEAERLQLERKLQDTQKLESLGVLAGGIAHDFNNILTGIMGNASMASLDLPGSSPVQDNLAAIKEGSRRAADLCKQMLAYSGKGRFVVQNLSLNRLVEETTHLLQISISKKAVLRFNLYPPLPPIMADATQIRQVIMNLVINASEAIGEKSGVISLNTGLTRVDHAYLGGTVLAPELPEGTYVYLEVSDSGCGMSPETQARIFDPFFTTKFAGRGLGLAAVLGIVRGHRGALKIYSEAGRGTTFKLLFPCAAGSEDLMAADSSPTDSWRGEGCVLVVDDEESVRSAAAIMLRKLGFEVALAADGREGVKAFRDEPERFALVIMDLTMPHMDGETAFTELRRIRGNVRVVLMSGFNEQEAISRFTGKGLASFLQKPFGFEELNRVLQAVVGGASGPA